MGKDKIILDIGSGSEPRGNICIDIPNSDYHRSGKDIILRKTLFVYSDAQMLPFRDKIFDGVICHHVLEHIPSPHIALDEMARTTTGRVKIVVPSQYNIGDLTSTAHIYTWNDRTLRNLMNMSFSHVMVRYLDRKTIMSPYRSINKFFPFLNSFLSKFGIYPEIYGEGWNDYLDE